MITFPTFQFYRGFAPVFCLLKQEGRVKNLLTFILEKVYLNKLRQGMYRITVMFNGNIYYYI